MLLNTQPSLRQIKPSDLLLLFVTFHDGLQRGHLLLPLAPDLVDGFLLGVLRHRGDCFDGLDLRTGLDQLLLDRTELLLSAIQRYRLALQLLCGGGGESQT